MIALSERTREAIKADIADLMTRAAQLQSVLDGTTALLGGIPTPAPTPPLNALTEAPKAKGGKPEVMYEIDPATGKKTMTLEYRAYLSKRAKAAAKKAKKTAAKVQEEAAKNGQAMHEAIDPENKGEFVAHVSEIAQPSQQTPKDSGKYDAKGISLVPAKEPQPETEQPGEQGE